MTAPCANPSSSVAPAPVVRGAPNAGRRAEPEALSRDVVSAASNVDLRTTNESDCCFVTRQRGSAAISVCWSNHDANESPLRDVRYRDDCLSTTHCRHYVERAADIEPDGSAIPPRIASVDEQMGDFAAFPPLPGCSDTQSVFLSDFKT